MVKPKELKGEELLTERARLVLVDVERAGEVTQDALEAQAEELFQGSMPYAEKQQIVQRALELYAEKRRPAPPPAPEPPEESKEPARLTSARTRELAIEYFRANPEGRSQDAFDWIEKTHGRPSCSRSSFRSTTACIARRELGIVARSGRRPKPDAHAKPTKSTKPADPPRRKQQTVEVNVERGSLRARPASAGVWRVSLEARVSEGLLKELMSDLVSGEEAACQS